MKRSIIAAMSENHVIGREGQLPWRLPNEMKWFVRKTTGHCLILGRKDFESHGCKPLPNRTNIVLTRQRDYVADGVVIVHSLEDALGYARERGEQEVFIAGGGEVYTAALDQGAVDRMYLTTVHAILEGDVFFPTFDTQYWQVTDLDHHPSDERHFASFTVRQYDRKDSL